MTDTVKRLGYGGSAVIDGVQVLITGGNLDKTDTPSYLEMMDIPPPASIGYASRSRVLHADGTTLYGGNISFDLNTAAVVLFSTSKLLKRGYSFAVGIHDGENSSTMANCQITNLTVSGAPGGLLTSSVTFISASPRVSGGSVTNNYILSSAPVGYWYSGGTDIRDWTLTMNQNVEPVYGNANTMTPKYLKTGLIDFTLDVSLYAEHIADDDSVVVATSSVTLYGVTTSAGHRFNGVSDLGTYSHSFTTSPDLSTSGSDGLIIS
jgi:hypothetical protein